MKGEVTTHYNFFPSVKEELGQIDLMVPASIKIRETMTNGASMDKG